MNRIAMIIVFLKVVIYAGFQPGVFSTDSVIIRDKDNFLDTSIIEIGTVLNGENSNGRYGNDTIEANYYGQEFSIIEFRADSFSLSIWETVDSADEPDTYCSEGILSSKYDVVNDSILRLYIPISDSCYELHDTSDQEYTLELKYSDNSLDFFLFSMNVFWFGSDTSRSNYLRNHKYISEMDSSECSSYALSVRESLESGVYDNTIPGYNIIGKHSLSRRSSSIDKDLSYRKGDTDPENLVIDGSMINLPQRISDMNPVLSIFTLSGRCVYSTGFSNKHRLENIDLSSIDAGNVFIINIRGRGINLSDKLFVK